MKTPGAAMVTERTPKAAAAETSRPAAEKSTGKAKTAAPPTPAPAPGMTKPGPTKPDTAKPGTAKPSTAKPSTAAAADAAAKAKAPKASPPKPAAPAPAPAVSPTTAKTVAQPAVPATPAAKTSEAITLNPTLAEAAVPTATPSEAATPAAAPAAPVSAATPAPAARPAEPRLSVPQGPNGRPVAISRASNKDESFSEGDFVVYPTHGVGKVEKIASEDIAGHKLELIHITFEENRMTLRVPVAKARSAGLRRLSTRKMFDEALAVLEGRARIKRTMWSRRAQEYEAKINSGDPVAIAEVVRDLHRNAGQPDQSFSERQIYEAAMDRLAAELGALDLTDKNAAMVKLAGLLKTT